MSSLMIVGGAPPPITLVQVKNGGIAASSTIYDTFPGPTTSGNTLIAVPVMGINGGGGIINNVTINAGAASFTKAFSFPNVAGQCDGMDIWIAPNITGGTNPRVTAAVSAAPVDYQMFLFEFANMPPALTYDGTGSVKSATTGTALTTNNITTVGVNNLIFAGFSTLYLVSAAAGTWPNRFIGGAGAAPGYSLVQYEIVSVPQTNLNAKASQASSGYYGGLILALKGIGA